MEAAQGIEAADDSDDNNSSDEEESGGEYKYEKPTKCSSNSTPREPSGCLTSTKKKKSKFVDLICLEIFIIPHVPLFWVHPCVGVGAAANINGNRFFAHSLLLLTRHQIKSGPNFPSSDTTEIHASYDSQ